MSLANIKIEVSPVGVGKIIVNDEDISDRVQAFQIEGALGEPTILRLSMTNINGMAEAQGIVEVGVPADLDKILATFDANEIEATVMDAMGWDDGGNLTSHVIELLRERVRAAQS